MTRLTDCGPGRGIPFSSVIPEKTCGGNEGRREETQTGKWQVITSRTVHYLEEFRLFYLCFVFIQLATKFSFVIIIYLVSVATVSLFYIAPFLDGPEIFIF